MKIDKDLGDLIFRALFCLIFIGLGGEHLLSDGLIMVLMPEWVPAPRLVSILCGLWLSVWGGCLLLGWRVQIAAVALGAFVIAVTLLVHFPGVFRYPPDLSPESYWAWDILQRTNLVKNLCLLGVCVHLLRHEVGRYSLQAYLDGLRANQQRPLGS